MVSPTRATNDVDDDRIVEQIIYECKYFKFLYQYVKETLEKCYMYEIVYNIVYFYVCIVVNGFHICNNIFLL